jgi:serine/threonine protein kinase
VSYLSGTELKRSKYRLLGLIGQGQFGQVFCAIHRPTGRLVALKNLEHDRFPTHQFLRELRFLLSLQHPNIVTCQALEHTSTGRYLVMDYCEGGTLRNLMPEEYRLNLVSVLKIVIDVLAGLEHAHSRGIVHCDIKPENILIQFDRTNWIARISDFGIARLNQEIWLQEGALGSPAYMAPERFYGQYSEASDLYAVGILLFELLAGYRPFSGTPVELRSAHLNQPLTLSQDMPESCRAVLTTALQKLPGRRFRSAAAMRAALEAALETVLQQTSPNGQEWDGAHDGQSDSAAVAVDQSASNLAASDLFVTVTPPYACPFRPVWQTLLERPVTHLMASEPNADRITVYQAGQSWVRTQMLSLKLLCSPEQELHPNVTQPPVDQLSSYQDLAEPVEQLLLRPGGGLAITQRSIVQVRPNMPLNSASGADLDLRPLVSWAESRIATVDPQGHWFATFGLAAPTASSSKLEIGEPLRLGKLPSLANSGSVPTPSPWVGSVLELGAELDLAAVEFASLLALDSRHWALIATTASGSLVQIISRRGSRVGSLLLPMQLRAIAPTTRPYQFLGRDEGAGTVLLIDLKPYRIKRWWVEISPDFWVATSWGYILAEASGQIVFLDDAGRGIGSLKVPQPITAMTPLQQQGLLIATWQTDQGWLYSLDLQELGLDLIF